MSKNLPTPDAEAFSNFVQGRAVFQSYLESNRGEELQQARSHFATATTRDSNFDIARLYLAVTETELRDPAAAIENLQTLLARHRYVPEVHVQLAYAHIKKYQPDSYIAAAGELDKASQAALTEKREDMISLIDAYRVFLLAVRGAYGRDAEAEKKAILEKAVSDGKELLKRTANLEKLPDEKLATQFEANNAIGGALMFLARFFPMDSDASQKLDQSEQYLQAALLLRPNSVRALQNMGRLFMFKGDRLFTSEAEKARQLYERAKEIVKKSLELNPYDAYPHYQMALLSVRTSDWEKAQNFVTEGKPQRGAVSADKWQAVEEAIRARDPKKVLSVNS